MKVMLAHTFKEKLVEFPCYMEPKLDGFRVLVCVTPKKAKFYSRNGNEFSSLVNYESAFIKLANEVAYVYGAVDKKMWFDAEVVTEDFATTSSEVRKHAPLTVPATFHIFDIQISEEYEVRHDVLSRSVARAKLKCLRLVPHTQVLSIDKLYEVYHKWSALGLEGAIVKKCGHLYEGRRSKSWLKMKGEETYTCVVTGFLEGTGKHAGRLGAFQADYKGTDVRVGTGLSDELRKDVWESPGRYLGARIEVKCQSVTAAGSLRHPRFIAVRVD